MPAAQTHHPQIDVPEMPPTRAVLVEKAASADHPGYLIRLAGDR